MGKRCLTLALALVLAFSLNACGNRPDTAAPPSGNRPDTAAPPSGSGGEKDDPSPASISFDGIYWTAVRHESYNSFFDRTEISTMPTEKWRADLYLNDDGTAQFREILGSCYNTCLLDASWWLGADNTLRLNGRDYYGDIVTVDGRIEKDNSVMLETPYGDRFYFEPTERPGPGGELCIADLEGVWRMVSGEVEGDEFSVKEVHMASLLNFERQWSDMSYSYTLQADYYSAHFLDTDAPTYQTEMALLVEQLDEPLMYGLPNELWSAQLFHEDSNAEYYVTLTDRNTLYLQQYYELDNAPTARTAIYMRSSSFLPETLESVVANEPNKTLIFYWRDPPAEVAEPLEAIPMTTLEEGGKNKLLLVGRWYETDIQFCTGKPELTADGTLQGWITETVLYEGRLQFNEPQWFSLTIPEGTPALCLFMKRPWDENWFTWPITDLDPFFVSGDTFLTEVE